MAETAADPRWIFLQEIVQKTLNVKADKWGKFIGNEELKMVVQEFLDKKETLHLVILLSAAGQLEANNDPPPAAKAKGRVLTVAFCVGFAFSA